MVTDFVEDYIMVPSKKGMIKTIEIMTMDIKK